MFSDQLLQGKTLGPVSKKRLHEMWQKFKTDSKSKVNSNSFIYGLMLHVCSSPCLQSQMVYVTGY